MLECILLDAIRLTSAFKALPQLTMASTSQLNIHANIVFNQNKEDSCVSCEMYLSDEWLHKVIIFVRNKIQSANVLCMRVCVCVCVCLCVCVCVRLLYFIHNSLLGGVGRGGYNWKFLYTFCSSKLIAVFSKRLFSYFREIQYAFRIRLTWLTLVNGTQKERPGSFRYTWV